MFAARLVDEECRVRRIVIDDVDQEVMSGEVFGG